MLGHRDLSAAVVALVHDELRDALAHEAREGLVELGDRWVDEAVEEDVSVVWPDASRVLTSSTLGSITTADTRVAVRGRDSRSV